MALMESELCSDKLLEMVLPWTPAHAIRILCLEAAFSLSDLHKVTACWMCRQGRCENGGLETQITLWYYEVLLAKNCRACQHLQG